MPTIQYNMQIQTIVYICIWNIFYLQGRTLPANRRQKNPQEFSWETRESICSEKSRILQVMVT